MTDLLLLLRYTLRLLLVVGPVEFVLGRALSRVGGMMQPGPVTDVINTLGRVGLALIEPVHVLVWIILAMAAAWPWLTPASPTTDLPAAIRWPRLLTPLLALFLLLSLALAVLPDPTLVALALNGVAAALMLGLAAQFAWRAAASVPLRVAVGLLGAAYAGYYVYVIAAQLADLQAGGNAAPPGGSDNPLVAAQWLGEALAVLWTVALFVAVGPWGPRGATRPPFVARRALAAAIPAVLIAVAPLFETWMQGVLAQMSLGFALYLPPLVYAVAVFCYVYALLTCWDRRAAAPLGLPWLREMGAALLLLPVAGFTLISNYQLAMAVLVFLLLTGVIRPLSLPLLPMPVRRSSETGQTRRVG